MTDDIVGRQRAALIEAGREAGAFLADDVSDDFLLYVPGEVKGRIAKLTARIEALEAALKTIVTRNRERTWTATDDNPESHWVEQDGQYAKIARAALTPEPPHAD